MLKKVCSITKPNGETCFIEEDVPLSPIGSGHARSDEIDARHISFRWTPGHFDMDFHNAPRRRLVLALEGGLEAETSDGEIRVFHPGDVWEIRDTWGKGHCSRAYQEVPFRTAFIALDDDVMLDRRAPLTEEPDRDQPIWIVDDIRDGGTGFHRAALPYTLGGIEGWVTDEYPAVSFHYLISETDGRLARTAAPGPSAECVLTGGFSGTSDGAPSYRVSTGEIVGRSAGTSRELQRDIAVGPSGFFLSVVAQADLAQVALPAQTA